MMNVRAKKEIIINKSWWRDTRGFRRLSSVSSGELLHQSHEFWSTGFELHRVWYVHNLNCLSFLYFRIPFFLFLIHFFHVLSFYYRRGERGQMKMLVMKNRTEMPPLYILLYVIDYKQLDTKWYIHTYIHIICDVRRHFFFSFSNFLYIFCPAAMDLLLLYSSAPFFKCNILLFCAFHLKDLIFFLFFISFSINNLTIKYYIY